MQWTHQVLNTHIKRSSEQCDPSPIGVECGCTAETGLETLLIDIPCFSHMIYCVYCIIVRVSMCTTMYFLYLCCRYTSACICVVATRIHQKETESFMEKDYKTFHISPLFSC
jgi:hypothetical protein